jgi:hypothetical protein
MAIAFDAVSSGSISNQVLTISHTTAASAVLFCSVGNVGNGALTITSVTYNGAAMTQLWAVDNSGGVEAQSSGWMLHNPASGVHDVVITLSGTILGYLAGACTSWTGVENASVSAAHRTVYTGGAGGGGGSITVIDSQAGDVVVDGIADYTVAITAAQTNRATQNNFVTSGYNHGTQSAAASGASTVMAWTGADYFSAGATALIPSAGGGGQVTHNTTSHPLGLRRGTRRRIGGY